MQFNRLVAVVLTMLLAGCVTTQSDSNSLGRSMPKSTKSEQATDAARIHTELAQRYLANGDLETALAKLNTALRFDPNYAPAHTVIALIYERINRQPDAEAHYRKAAALEPAKGDYSNNLGQFLCTAGNYAEADIYFRKALADPFNQSPDLALTNAGLCQLRAKNFSAAESSFRDALARNPNNAQALFQLANALFLNNDAFRARAFIQRFDALGQPDPAALKLGHDIEFRLGNKDAALTYSKRLRDQFPDSEQALDLNRTASP